MILLGKVAGQCKDHLVYKLNDIQQEIANLTTRLGLLEQDISFSVVTSVHLMLDDNPAVFDTVRHNNGQGYDSSSGTKRYTPCLRGALAD